MKDKNITLGYGLILLSLLMSCGGGLYLYLLPVTAAVEIDLEIPVAVVSAQTEINFTEEDVSCLAKNIYFEARDQSILGQYYVAWVTLNRVKSRKFPNTVCEVVWQRKQFSWTHDGKSDNPKEKKVFLIAELIAKDTLNDSMIGNEDFSDGALYYHAEYTSPYWISSLNRITQIDKHIFYK